MLRLLILTFAMSLTAIVAQAQSTDTVPAFFVADDVSIDQDRVMKAQGNVEAFQGKIRLKAVSISYDQDLVHLVSLDQSPSKMEMALPYLQIRLS